jgi:hypothetical protein
MTVHHSSEQLEEIQSRFHALVPRVVKDDRFMTGIARNEEGDLLPFVYLAVDDTNDNAMPTRYINVIKVAENEFRLYFVNFFLVLGSGIPVPCWPWGVIGDELDDKIIQVWESWFSLNKALADEVARLRQLRSGPRPLPL